MSQGEYVEANELLYGLVRRLYPGLYQCSESEGEDPSPAEVTCVDELLGVLLSLAQALRDSNRAAGVRSAYQKKVFAVSECGLLVKPQPSEFELVHGRSMLSYETVAVAMAQTRELEKVTRVETAAAALVDKANQLRASCSFLLRDCDSVIKKSSSTRSSVRAMATAMA